MTCNLYHFLVAVVPLAFVFYRILFGGSVAFLQTEADK